MTRFLLLGFALGCSAAGAEPSATQGDSSTTATDTLTTDTNAVVDSAPPVTLAWTRVTLPDPMLNVHFIRGYGPKDVWISGFSMARKGLFRYDGKSWSLDEFPWPFPPDDVFRVNASDAWAIGGGPGEAWRRQGGTWSKSTTFMSNATDSVFAIGSDVFVAGGSTGIGTDAPIHHFDGTTWKPFPTGDDQRVYAIWGATKDDLWACTNYGLIHYASGAWSKSLATGYCKRIFGFAANDVWFLGESPGKVYRWNGSAVSEVVVKADYNVSDLWGSDPKNVWAVSSVGVFRFDGTTWNEVSKDADAPKDGLAVGGSGPNDVWVAGYQRLDHLAPVP